MNSEEDTLPNNQVILDAIKELSTKVDSLKQEVDSLKQDVDSKFEAIDFRLEDMRLQLMSVDVRIDRIEALTHEVLNVAYNARADVKVLREEVKSWSKDVQNLQLKFA